MTSDGGLLAEPQVKLTLSQQIKEKQGVQGDFALTEERILCFRGRLCIPCDEELTHVIITKAHCSPYSMHPGINKMYHDLCELHWWPGLK
ncbi:zinc finger and BTB domain-containing protein 11-like [Gossypium australe]|uniref:Zinc finger and BTB domain-containing protein 11-like n=1 Tax=Gossypium australe TaxID=47621 RepID=A0A5B6X132_9ROSI|nr:zinc finger and BTB domain-containing protein 11-like [Gossypium australe]